MADKKLMKIKKGDLVQVLTGKDKSKQGKVIAVYPDTQRVLVEGVNRVTRTPRPGQTAARLPAPVASWCRRLPST